MSIIKNKHLKYRDRILIFQMDLHVVLVLLEDRSRFKL